MEGLLEVRTLAPIQSDLGAVVSGKMEKMMAKVTVAINTKRAAIEKDWIKVFEDSEVQILEAGVKVVHILGDWVYYPNEALVSVFYSRDGS